MALGNTSCTKPVNSQLPPCLQAICGQPHRLCSHQGHSRGRVEHVLLDPLHLHHPQRLLEADRDRCGSSRHRQNHRPRGAALCPLLPVGLLLPLLPGRIYLQYNIEILDHRPRGTLLYVRYTTSGSSAASSSRWNLSII